jgi:hypothetical protein
VPRRDPRYLRRNALVALGNAADPHDESVAAHLRALADGDDELLAEHAEWALDRLDARARSETSREPVAGATGARDVSWEGGR